MLRLIPRSSVKLGIFIIFVGLSATILMWHFQVQWNLKPGFRALKDKFIENKRLTQEVTKKLENDLENGDEIEITQRSSLPNGNKLKANPETNNKEFSTAGTGTTKEKISTVISSTTKKSLTTQLSPTLRSKSSLSNTAEMSTPQLHTTEVTLTILPTTSSNLPTTYIYGEAGCSPNPWRGGLLELFTEWSQIAKRNNIEYVIFYGTLLGAMRTGDVIPYDSDIDLLVNASYFPKIKDIAVTRGFDNGDGKIRLVIQPEFDYDIPSTSRKRYTCKGKLTPHMVDQCSFQEPLARLIKGSLHVELYHFYDKGKHLEDPSEDNKIKVYQKSDFFPLKPCQFMGIDTMCPHNPWKLLKIFIHTENLDPIKKCKGGKWLKTK